MGVPVGAGAAMAAYDAPGPGYPGNLLEGWWRTGPAVQPISEDELQRWVRKLLASRIIYWQAQALAPEVNHEGEIARRAEQESPLDLLTRVRARRKMDEIAHRAHVGRSTLYQWLRDPDSIRPENAAAIVSTLRMIAAEIAAE
jgi:hypothetical protein